jgi:uncharacterized protein (TIGR02996 family)
MSGLIPGPDRLNSQRQPSDTPEDDDLEDLALPDQCGADHEGAAAPYVPVPMPESFLAAIRDRPDDDSPRLILADYLNERGDVRGEFILEALRNQDVEVRYRAMEALGSIGRDAVEAVPALVAVLHDQDADVRYRAAIALSTIGPEAREAAPALENALRDQNADVRSAAAIALGLIGPEAREAVPALTEALRDQDPNVRYRAALALGSIGPEARAAVPALVETLRDQDEGVRFEATWAINRITGGD